MRNPKWHRDEIILALDLYFEKDRGFIGNTNPKIIDLSKTLNKLPIHKNIPELINFRSPSGVSLKLSNFLAIDPDYSGKGMSSASKLDKIIFEEYHNNQQKLKLIANKIKSLVDDIEINNEIYKIEDDEISESESVKEGKVLYKYHKYRERNTKIVRRKKELSLKKYGTLKCEICEFDFFEKYGEIGKGFIECHHILPLYQSSNTLETKLEDLCLLCSNCHRMVHKDLETPIENFKEKYLKY